jgi:hypothetical protein
MVPLHLGDARHKLWAQGCGYRWTAFTSKHFYARAVDQIIEHNTELCDPSQIEPSTVLQRADPRLMHSVSTQ